MDFIVEDVVAAMFHLGDNLTFLQKRRDKKFFSCQLNDEQIKRVRKSLVMNEAFESKLDIFSLVSKHYLVQASGSSACACCSSSYSAYACYKSRPHRPTGPLHTVASRPCPAAPARPVVALTVHVVHIAQLFLCMHLLVPMGYIVLACRPRPQRPVHPTRNSRMHPCDHCSFSLVLVIPFLVQCIHSLIIRKRRKITSTHSSTLTIARPNCQSHALARSPCPGSPAHALDRRPRLVHARVATVYAVLVHFTFSTDASSRSPAASFVTKKK